MNKIFFPKHKKAKILIIDDEQDVCESLKSILEKTGRFDVWASTDAFEGISLVESQHPDLILLDIVMPEIDGTEVAERLQNNEAAKDIIIVFTSVLADTEEVKENKGLIGGRPFISKPIKKDDLIARIESLLSERAAADK